MVTRYDNINCIYIIAVTSDTHKYIMSFPPHYRLTCNAIATVTLINENTHIHLL